MAARDLLRRFSSIENAVADVLLGRVPFDPWWAQVRSLFLLLRQQHQHHLAHLFSSDEEALHLLDDLFINLFRSVTLNQSLLAQLRERFQQDHRTEVDLAFAAFGLWAGRTLDAQLAQLRVPLELLGIQDGSIEIAPLTSATLQDALAEMEASVYLPWMPKFCYTAGAGPP